MSKIMSYSISESHSETGSDCFYCHPGVNRTMPLDFFRIIRVAYRKPVGELLMPLPVVYPLAYETFTPELVRPKDKKKNGERLEKMNETFAKAIRFLQNSGRFDNCQMNIYFENSELIEYNSLSTGMLRNYAA